MKTNDTKYVCVISHPKYPGKYKVGVTLNYEIKLREYRLYDFRCKLEYASKNTPYYREVEKYILDKFHNENEWVKGNLKDIIDEIEKKNRIKIKGS